MFKKMLIVLLGIAMTIVFSDQVMASDDGDERKGKFTYRKIYKTCFEKGLVESSKPPLNPDMKTQAQWKRIFDKKRFTDFGCKEEWDKLSKDQLANIFAYLHAHAADSPSPAKCN